MKTNATGIIRTWAGHWRHMLGVLATAAILVPATMAGHPELPLDLRTAGDFVILAKSGISTVPNSDITGDIGVSPIDHTAITGFALEPSDGVTVYSESAQVTGRVYADNYLDPTPDKMTAAISDMETAYTVAAGRTTPDETEFMSGHIGGQTFTPGLYKWSTTVWIDNEVWLDAEGDPDAIFIFQISGDLLVANGQRVLLAGRAQAKNIFWQVAGGAGARIGTTAHMEGIVLTATAIIVQTDATFNGKLLAQTAVTLDQNEVMDSDLIPTPLFLEIISEHGIGDWPVGIYTNASGTILTNTVTGMETLGGTQYVNTGWVMTGNDPLLGTTNTMTMTHTNDAVLAWQWSTNYLLSLSAPNGAITNATPGWKPAGDVYDLYPVPDPGFAFDHWEVNGLGQGSGTPLTVSMDGERNVLAVFSSSMLGDVSWNVTWVFDPRLGFYVGTLTISNPEGATPRYGAPFGFAVESTAWHWLRFPTGMDADTGMHYLDLTPAVLSLLTGTGNGDLYLDPGESVTVGGIQLMGRRTAEGLLTAQRVTPEAIDGNSPLLVAIAEMSPDGGEVLHARYPTFAWPEVPLATWYKLWLTRDGQGYHQQWVQGTTTWVPSQALRSGAYRWWVQPWSPVYGYGAWSDAADFAMAWMLPAALVQIGPSGPQTETTLEYRWQKDAYATWYRLWTGRVGGGTFHDQWYPMSGTGEAVVSVSQHRSGDYTWWVAGWSPDGTGPWAGPMAFSAPDPAPAKPVLIAPVGLTFDAQPLFQWQVAPKAEWYRVYVASSAGNVMDQWTQHESLASPGVLASGTHSWWVGAWNQLSGTTVWSDRLDFTVVP